MERAEILNSSASSEGQRLHPFVWGFWGFFCIFAFKGERVCTCPMAGGVWGEEGRVKPLRRIQLLWPNNSKFSLNPGRTMGDNSDCYKFSSEALPAKLLSFPSYFGDRKVPGGYFQPNMKSTIFSSEEKVFEIFFSPLFFCALPKKCVVSSSLCQTFLIYMYSQEGID